MTTGLVQSLEMLNGKVTTKIFSSITFIIKPFFFYHNVVQ